MTDLSSHECSELWKKFEAKIESDWNKKYKKKAGHNFLGLKEVKKNKTDISLLIYTDIKEHLKKKEIPTDELPTELYFYSLLQKGITTSSHANTIETLIYYLDFKSIDDFSNSLESPKNKYFEKIKIGSSTLKKVGLALSFILTIGLSIYSYSWYNTKYFSENEKTFFKTLIENAGDTEFNLYKTADTSRLNELDKYFTKKGQARLNILGEMDKPLRRKYKLRELESHRRIIDYVFIQKNNSEVRIQTKEKWKVVWYDPKTDEDLSKYDTTNTQLYLIIKEDNLWKIDLNDYDGKKKKMKP
jgi:hypothetical protein